MYFSMCGVDRLGLVRFREIESKVACISAESQCIWIAVNKCEGVPENDIANNDIDEDWPDWMYIFCFMNTGRGVSDMSASYFPSRRS